MNPSLVIDASASFAWLFSEERGDEIDRLVEQFQCQAPSLWKLKMVNTILVQLRRRKIEPDHAEQLLVEIDEFPVDLHDEPFGRTAVTLGALARPHQLTAYDAVYLDLAIRLGLPLPTLDRNLTASANSLGVPLALASMP